jgi:hypothetical protein
MKKTFAILVFTAILILMSGCIEIDEIESIEFSEYPKTIYVLNENLEYFTVEVTTAKGAETLNSYDSRLLISGFDTTTTGTKTMTITVEGLEDASINFVYSVVSSVSDLLFGGGTGTEIDPYEISTPQHLSNIRFALDKHFVLIDDIDLAGIQWDPIGKVVTESCGDRCMSILVDESEFFTGSLKGNIEGTDENYSIMNLSTDYTENFGLFIGIKDALIQNLDLVDVEITGYSVGALAFTLGGNSTISNITITGAISTGFSAGGLTYSVYGDIREEVVTTIIGVTNNVNITGTRTASAAAILGGLIGQTTVMGENGDWNDSNNDLKHNDGEHTALFIKNKLVIEDSHNTGNITHIENGVAGTIAGQLIGQATKGGWEYSGMIEIKTSTGTGVITGNTDTSDVWWGWSFYGFNYLEQGPAAFKDKGICGELVGRNNLSDPNNLTYVSNEA